MIPDRKKPGVAFWATVVVVVLLVGYPLSIGPAHGIVCALQSPWSEDAADFIFHPLALACGRSSMLERAVIRYADFWVWRRPRLASGFILPPGFRLESIAM
jgi:hypothetical protein